METAYSRYEIVETLGTGVTSRVDKARDPVIGRTVALKTFLQGFGSCDLRQQFAREAQIIGRLSHPNIVALYDVGTNKDGVPYFVMEYVSGRTLEAVMAGGGALPLARTALWAADLAGALSLAHRANIIHGDVKPANIIVTPEGQVKLGDFGVARFATQTSGYAKVMGTPAYLSPEQIQGQLQDTRSDLFSLGIILYQMSCGVRPFNGSSIGAVCAQIISCAPPPPSHYNPSLPPTFDRVVMRCLTKDPAKRYPTAEALASSLYPFARNNELTQPKPARPSARDLLSWWSRPLQQKDIWIAAAGLVLMLTTGLVMHVAHKRPVLAASTIPSSGIASLPATSSSSPSSGISSPALVQANTLTAGSFRATVDSPPVVIEDSDASAHAVPGKVSRVRPLPTPKLSKKPEKKIAEPSPAAPALPAETGKQIAAEAQTLPRKDTGSLSIQVLSSVANETLAVYAGSELLLSTPLESAHIGETLHFDRPLSVGPHPLRVALYNANSDLHVQKEGLAEVVADGQNILGIRINRRPKLLIRKETALEISWPNQLSADAR